MPHLGYIICTTPRSGSTLLCRMLTATGSMGKPHSYFRQQDIEDWAKDWGVADDQLPGTIVPSHDYLNAVIAEAKGGTTICGLRLMYESLNGLMNYLSALSFDGACDRDCLEAAFGSLLFIHLQREDTVDQAISLLRAEQTGLWHKAKDGSEIERLEPVKTPGYNFDLLRTYVRTLNADKAAWATWFKRQGITPLSITYDALSNEPETVVMAVGQALGLRPPERADINVPTAKLSDETNMEWKARYASDLLKL